MLTSGDSVFGGDDDNGGEDIDFGNIEIDVELTNTGIFPQASGDAKLEPRADRTDFSVEGELEFRNPVEPGKVLLDFDPRGQQIDVLEEGSTVILETLFPFS